MRTSLGRLTLAVMSITAMLLASCTATPATPATSGTSAPTSATSAPTTVPATPTPDTRPQGSIKIGVEFQSGSSLDPVTGTDGAFGAIARLAVFDTLQTPLPNGEAGPGIVEKWAVAPDGMSQTLSIRKGVKFSNGDDLTAADVKFTIDRLMGPDSVASFAPAWRNQIASVEAKDSYTVVINNKKKGYMLPSFTFHDKAGVVDKKYFEEKGLENFKNNPVGSGAWKVVKYVPGTSLELEAVDNHWRAKPQFKNVTIMNVPELATRVAMLKTGELDLAEIAVDSVNDLKAAGIKTASYYRGSQSALTVFYDPANPSQSPFGNVKVRQAMQWSINTPEIIEKLFVGNGGKMNLLGFPVDSSAIDASQLKADPYDPEGAKKLLAEAGYANGFSTKAFDLGGLESTVILAVGGYLQKVGINVQNEPIETGTYITLYTPTIKPQAYNHIRAGMAYPVLGYDSLDTYYHSTRGLHKNIKNAKLDELIDTIPQTADPVEQKKLMTQAAVLAQQEYTQLRIMAVSRIVGYGSKIANVPAYASSLGIPGVQLELLTRGK